MKAKLTSVGQSARRDSLPLILSILVGITTYAFYLLTLSPGVSWAHHSEDSGDLITAAWTLGIPHPTGYPLFTLLGWIWSHVIPFGSVAWRMNALSAFCGAAASLITVRAVWASFKLLPEGTYTNLTLTGRAVASVSAGLTLAFAATPWEQSVITEVYPLNLFFFSLITWILIELLILGETLSVVTGDEIKSELGNSRGRLIAWLGASWGLALTNHLTSIFLLPGILLVLFFGRSGVKFKELGKGIIWLVLALLLYLYLPIRSLMNPPLDWGNPENFENFIWVVTGKQFRQIMFILLPYQMLHRIVRYYSIPAELGAVGAFAALLGVCRMLLAKRRGTILLVIHTLFLVASSLFYLANYHIWDPEGYLLPMVLAISFWAGWMIVLLVDLPKGLVPIGRGIAILILVAAPIWGFASHWEDADLSGTRDAITFGEETFELLEENALVLEVRYERAFTLWYYREVEYVETRDDVALVFIEHATFEWGLDLLRRKYPDIELPETPITGSEKDAFTAGWIIEHNIDKRPIYIGATVDYLMEEGYRFQAVGLMYRVFRPDSIQGSI